jgi:cell division protein FtsW (lipid II flippase)
MVLLVLLRDFGLIVLLNAVLLVMAVLASGRWSYLVTGLLLVGGAGVLLLRFMPHGSSRVDVWLNPFADPTGRGWQVLQSLSAMATGGLWGAGLGAGQPTAIPIAASDFVYAAWAEETGYVGCALVLGVYLLFFYRGFRLADSLRDPFAQSLATGLTAALALQTLLNLGGVTKAIPLTGITLPFLSLGGSSLITSFVMLGLLLALSDPGKK